MACIGLTITVTLYEQSTSAANLAIVPDSHELRVHIPKVDICSSLLMAGPNDSLNFDAKIFSLTNHPQMNVWIEKSKNKKGFNVTVWVPNIAIGKALLAELFANIGIDISSFVQSDKTDLEAPNGIHAFVISSRASVLGVQKMVKVEITNALSGSAEGGEMIIKSLVKSGLHQKSIESANFDLSTSSGLHEWAMQAIGKDVKLDAVEVDCLHDLATSEYRSINGSLRSEGVAPSNWRVAFIDSAIAKSRTNRPLNLYRVVQRQDLNQIWEDIHSGKIASSEMLEDPAYLFASLNKDVAKWWQEYDGQDNGIILDIHVPTGTSAVYIDSEIEKERGYLEVVLGRNVAMKAVGAKKEGAYRILTVNVHK